MMTPYSGIPDDKKFSDTKKFYETLALMNAASELKYSLKDCIDAATQYLAKRRGHPIAYLNDELANPMSPYYRMVVDSLPLDNNIYKQLIPKEAKLKFIQHILMRDETNYFQYICDDEKNQKECPYKIRDPDHPFVCRHFSKYMFHKYRFEPANYDNDAGDSHYNLKPVDEKFRIPIREVYIKYSKKPDWHSINAIYLGYKSDPENDSNINNWYIYEPQTDMPVSLKTDETEGTKYYLLHNGHAPIENRPRTDTIYCPVIQWTNGQTDVTVKTDENCSWD